MFKIFKYLFAACVVAIFISGCGKDTNIIEINPGDTAKTNKSIIEITVKDADSWTSENTELNNVTGATVSLFNSLADVRNNRPQSTGLTDGKGVILANVTTAGTFYFTVSKGDAKNIYSGYLIDKVYLNNGDLAGAEANQPTPAVGFPKVTDVNGDGTITAADEQTADIITAQAGKTVKRTLFIAKPIASKLIEVSNPVYPDTKPNVEFPGQCYGSVTVNFTCPEKYWNSADQTLLFIGADKTLRKINGVVIITGTGNGYNLDGKLNAGLETREGKTLTYSNVVIQNGLVTGKVSALIEPGACTGEAGYLDTYVSVLKAALCYTTLNNVIQATVTGKDFTKGSNDINYTR